MPGLPQRLSTARYPYLAHDGDFVGLNVPNLEVVSFVADVTEKK